MLLGKRIQESLSSSISEKLRLAILRGEIGERSFFKDDPNGPLKIAMTVNVYDRDAKYIVAIEDLKAEVKALQTIRQKYEQVYGIRIFADGTEVTIDREETEE